MDETKPLAPAPYPTNNNNNNKKETANPHSKPRPPLLKSLLLTALGKSPNTGPRYQLQPIPIVLSWISAAAVLGLSAFIVARAQSSYLRNAAVFNLILGAAGTLLHLGLDIRFPVSRSRSDPRPSIGSCAYIVTKGIVWSLAAAAIFVSAAAYEESGSHLSKRKGGRGGGGGRGSRGSGGIGPATPESVAVVCGVLDCVVV
ncbi:hypothetical protein BJX64DRAFT_285888 [Aspergillus heterothallicus]